MTSAPGVQPSISLEDDWSVLPLLEKETSLRLDGHQCFLTHFNKLSLFCTPQLIKTQSSSSNIFEKFTPFPSVPFYL